ncbi:hypothetical protein ULMS_23370 [Patiriisocius marinistellae]|uniref:Uncharacterized protein n=1 Tax=Patiriisocius marinistellae TaxID=2494560 RepID=A0A5J4G264_9FLAO|nr:hypothetical protein ULMS_23370 [Patiriisocius marinistellae]
MGIDKSKLKKIILKIKIPKSTGFGILFVIKYLKKKTHIYLSSEILNNHYNVKRI